MQRFSSLGVVRGKILADFSLFLLVLLCVGFFPLLEVVAEELLPEIHYERVIPPVPRSGNKSEVVEVFNFKCPHCFTLSPYMAAWAEKNKHRFTYKALPVYWGRQTDIPLRAYFVAEYSGKGEAMKAAIFKAHFNNTANIENVDEMGFIAEAIGLDATQFRDHMESMGVLTQLKRAAALQDTFGVFSTPTIVINGTYRVSPGKHARDAHGEVSYDRLFEIIEILANR